MRVPVAPYPYQPLLLFSFNLAILLGLKWYLIVDLIYISLIPNDIEHLFMRLFALAYLFRRIDFRSFALF